MANESMSRLCVVFSPLASFEQILSVDLSKYLTSRNIRKAVIYIPKSLSVCCLVKLDPEILANSVTIASVGWRWNTTNFTATSLSGCCAVMLGRLGYMHNVKHGPLLCFTCFIYKVNVHEVIRLRFVAVCGMSVKLETAV